MKTFLEYVETRDNVGKIILSIAEEAENNPQLNEILIKEGFWDSIGNIGKGIGKFAQGVWSGGGIKPGFQAGMSAFSGPSSQIQYALGNLNKALKAIQTDANWQNSVTADGKDFLGKWLKKKIDELTEQLPQFQNKQIQIGQNATTTAATAQPQPQPTQPTQPVANPTAKTASPVTTP